MGVPTQTLVRGVQEGVQEAVLVAGGTGQSSSKHGLEQSKSANTKRLERVMRTVRVLVLRDCALILQRIQRLTYVKFGNTRVEQQYFQQWLGQ